VLIDFHAHLFNEEGYGDSLAETARSLGFDYMCIGGGQPQYGLARNEEVLRRAQTYPELFVPFAYLDLSREGAHSVEEFRQAGFRGLRFSIPPKPYDSDDFFPVYEAAQSLGMPVLFHTGFAPVTPLDGALDVRCERMRPVHLDVLARRFPRLAIVGSSLGYPWCEEALETLRRHSNVYFDISGEVFQKKGLSFFRGLFRAEASAAPPARSTETCLPQLVFGSAVKQEDIPTAERDHQRFFRALALGQNLIDAIMGNTAAELLNNST